jgi:peroxiredoxin
MAISEGTVGVALAVAAALASACGGAASAGALEPGAEATAQLHDLDGAPRGLDLVVREHEATVLVWWATRCPCVTRYHERIEALPQRLGPRVAVLAVASNADDDPARMRRVAAERGLTVPLVVDPGARLADALGVPSTPAVVVLDRRGAVRYRGWIDNERRPGEDGRVAWLEEAVEAVLAGRDGPSASPMYGCTITKRLGQAGRCSAPAR